MKDNTRVIAALLIGAAAGAALGLLLAPEKGEKIRGGIADYVSDLVEAALNKTQSTTQGLKDLGGTAFDRAKSKFRGVVNEVADYKDDTVNAAKSKIKNITDEALDTFNGAKTNVKGTANDWNNSIQKS
jgi:gas vesicle protein